MIFSFESYLAGLIDGEGYIALLPVRSKEVKNPCFEPVIKIGMTGSEALELFTDVVKVYGGYIEKRNGYSKGGREVYTYLLKGKKKVLVLLLDIVEGLYIKEEQARLLIEYCNMGSSHSNYGNFDPLHVARKLAIYNELKRLKQSPATTN